MSLSKDPFMYERFHRELKTVIKSSHDTIKKEPLITNRRKSVVTRIQGVVEISIILCLRSKSIPECAWSNAYDSFM
jgi:hypothetical protein